jgi:dUTP pyrophosphatase
MEAEKNNVLTFDGVNVPLNQLFWAKVKPNAIIPTKDDENAGYDIYAYREDENTSYEIGPFETKVIPTGIAAAVSEGYYLQAEERGSTGAKGIKYGAGVIDSSYRGEIFISVTNTHDYPIIFGPDHKEVHVESQNGKTVGMYYPITKAVFQLIVHDVPKMIPKEISYEELQKIPSKRGTGALGSSGK